MDAPLFLTLSGQAAAEAVHFLDGQMKAAVVALLLSVAGYFGAKAYRLKRLKAPLRRSSDDRMNRMEKAFGDRCDSIEKRLGTMEQLQRNDIARTNGVGEEVQAARREIAHVKGEVAEVKGMVQGVDAKVDAALELAVAHLKGKS